MDELFRPPDDLLRFVFDQKTLGDWRSVPNPPLELRHRINIAGASGPLPTDARLAQDLRHLRAHKSAWHVYIYSAYACRMFEGDRGKDLLGRLRSRRRDQFQAALAECMVCWFLAGRLKLNIDAYAPGRNGRMLEMRIVSQSTEIGVEVKAPSEEIVERTPGESTYSTGDDSGKLAPCMVAANRQLDDTNPNLLVLVPHLERSIVHARDDLIRAAYGESRITSVFDPDTGTCGDTSIQFAPSGRFLETQRPGGKSLKPDGLPAHRRISAILCIEERVSERYPFPNPFALLEGNGLYDSWSAARDRSKSPDNEVWVEHDAILVHNPYAYHPLPQQDWREIPQLIHDGSTMRWTDDYKINV